MSTNQSRTPSIVFDTKPDATGMGRLIVDGRFYGLPVAAVLELQSCKEQVQKLENERDRAYWECL